MKKILMTAIIAFLLTSTIIAQGNKSIFFEVGGNGLGFSANFDARFSKAENGFGYRIGIGVMPALNGGIVSTSSTLTIPVGVNYLIGHAPSYLEVGAGATYVSSSISVFGSDKEKSSGVGFIPSAGYRFAPAGNAFQARFFISPVIGSGGAAFWGGVSIGYKF